MLDWKKYIKFIYQYVKGERYFILSIKKGIIYVNLIFISFWLRFTSISILIQTPLHLGVQTTTLAHSVTCILYYCCCILLHTNSKSLSPTLIVYYIVLASHWTCCKALVIGSDKNKVTWHIISNPRQSKLTVFTGRVCKRIDSVAHGNGVY